MKLDKKILTVFIITLCVVAGTALASISTMTSTQSISIGNGPSITAAKTTTTTTLSSGNSDGKSVTVVTNSPEATLANLIFRVLDIPITVNEVSVLRTRNMGYGEITLAYNLASASGRSVDEILDMRFHQKMGWGKIAKTLGVKLHSAADNSTYILREARLDKDAVDFTISIKVDLDEEDKDNDKANHEKHSGHSQQKNNDDKDDKNDSHKAHGKSTKKD